MVRAEQWGGCSLGKSQFSPSAPQEARNGGIFPAAEQRNQVLVWGLADGEGPWRRDTGGGSGVGGGEKRLREMLCDGLRGPPSSKESRPGQGRAAEHSADIHNTRCPDEMLSTLQVSAPGSWAGGTPRNRALVPLTRSGSGFGQVLVRSLQAGSACQDSPSLSRSGSCAGSTREENKHTVRVTLIKWRPRCWVKAVRAGTLVSPIPYSASCHHHQVVFLILRGSTQCYL